MPQITDEQSVTTAGSLGYAEITISRAFPHTISIDGASITMSADGTWSGDGPAFLAAIKTLKDYPSYSAADKMAVWLVARAIAMDISMGVDPAGVSAR